jgi:hypothetical protein
MANDLSISMSSTSFSPIVTSVSAPPVNPKINDGATDAVVQSAVQSSIDVIDKDT